MRAMMIFSTLSAFGCFGCQAMILRDCPGKFSYDHRGLNDEELLPHYMLTVRQIEEFAATKTRLELRVMSNPFGGWVPWQALLNEEWAVFKEITRRGLETPDSPDGLRDRSLDWLRRRPYFR